MYIYCLPLGGGSAKFVLGAANTNGQTGWLPLQSCPLYIVYRRIVYRILIIILCISIY